MKTIRNNVFETNSSSCHALAIVTEDEFAKFKNGELVAILGEKHLSAEERIEYKYNIDWNKAHFETWEQVFNDYKEWIKCGIEKDVKYEGYWKSLIKELFPLKDKNGEFINQDNLNLDNATLEFFKSRHDQLRWIIITYEDFINSYYDGYSEPNYAKVYNDRVELNLEYHD